MLLTGDGVVAFRVAGRRPREIIYLTGARVVCAEDQPKRFLVRLHFTLLHIETATGPAELRVADESAGSARSFFDNSTQTKG